MVQGISVLFAITLLAAPAQNSQKPTKPVNTTAAVRVSEVAPTGGGSNRPKVKTLTRELVVPGGGYSPVEWPTCGSTLDGRAQLNAKLTFTMDEKGEWKPYLTISYRGQKIDVASCVEVFVPQAQCGVRVYHMNTEGAWVAVSERGEPGTQPQYAGFVRRQSATPPPGETGGAGCYIQFRNWREGSTRFQMQWDIQG